MLEERLEQVPCRTTKAAIDFVSKEFDIDYSVSGMNALLKRMGYVYKKPQPIPGKLKNSKHSIDLSHFIMARLYECQLIIIE